MKRIHPAIVVLAVILLGASAGVARVEVNSDGSGDFDNYRTYTWKAGAPAQNPKMEDFIVGRVEAQLESKGLLPVEEEPDLLVVVYVLPDKVSATDLSNSGLEFWSGVTSVSPSDVGVGTLVVDLVDTGTENVVWRGIAWETVKGSFDKMERKVGSAIEKMFKRYPPR
jgi:hypothetical protein